MGLERYWKSLAASVFVSGSIALAVASCTDRSDQAEPFSPTVARPQNYYACISVYGSAFSCTWYQPENQEIDPCEETPWHPQCSNNGNFTTDDVCYIFPEMCDGDGSNDGGTDIVLNYDPFSAEEERLGGCEEVPGTSTPAGGGSTWNPSAFASYLRSHATQPKLMGGCARAVRRALCDGGGLTGACDAYVRPLCAKDYGPWLETLGFSSVATGSGRSYPPGYTPMAGDIVVLTYAGEPNGRGHVAGWDGSNWSSDAIQDELQPTPNTKGHRTYTIYRH